MMNIIKVYDIKRRKIVHFPTSCTLGRKSADINFPYDKNMSRIHCKFIVDKNKFYIQDLGSTNKTKVNNEEYYSYDTAEIKHGHLIEFGKQKFKFLKISRGQVTIEEVLLSEYQSEKTKNQQLKNSETCLRLSFNHRVRKPPQKKYFLKNRKREKNKNNVVAKRSRRQAPLFMILLIFIYALFFF